MTIKSIEINNCLSIKKAKIELSNVNCFIGENGVGKSTIYKIIQYFYDALSNDNTYCSLHDKINPFNDTVDITINYDFSFYNSWLNSNFLSRGGTDYYNELWNLKKYTSDDILSVTLKHSKKFNSVSWSNDITYKERSFIRSLYPYYLIETRKIDLHDWSQLWDMIAELSIFPTELEGLSKKMGEEQGQKQDRVFNIINEAFNEQDFKISVASIKEQFSYMMKLRLKGDRPNFKNQELNYYSDGLNSYNYLKLFMQLVGEISDYRKTKYPIILLDEPEIGLHPKLIDHIVDNLGTSLKTTIWINTHSPRLVKNIISKKQDYTLYHVSLINDYTIFKKMIKPKDSREISRISEKEASFYFSSGLILVEGETEIELLNNNHLKNMFPFLNDIDIYSFDGDDNLKQGIVNPSEKNLNIPYVLLLDGDKLYNFRNKKLRFNKDKAQMYLFDNASVKNKEVFYFGEKRKETLLKREKINQIIAKKELITDEEDFPVAVGYSYDEVMKLIREYHNIYNIYPLKNTVEGLLISKYNYENFAQWFSSCYKIQYSEIEKILNYSSNDRIKTTLLRLLVKGKYDSLTTEKFFKENILPKTSGDTKKIYHKIEKFKIKSKTEWITAWLDYFFDNHVYIYNDKNVQMNIFKNNFAELYDIIRYIEVTISRE